MYSKLEKENNIYSLDFIIEKEPLVNTYISLPKDKISLNCASFTAGIIEAVLTVTIFTICELPYASNDKTPN